MRKYFDSGKFERKFDPNYAPPYEFGNKNEKRKMLLLESTFDMESQTSIYAFWDMNIYKPSPNMSCITEDFINDRRYRKPEKVELLQSMLDSKLGLFEITATDFNDGYAYLKEIFTGKEYKITDIALSSNQTFDDTYIYMRIVTYLGVSFGTGLSFLFSKTDPFIQDFIKRNKENYSPLGEYVRFTELYNRYSNNDNGMKIFTQNIK